MVIVVALVLSGTALAGLVLLGAVWLRRVMIKASPLGMSKKDARAIEAMLRQAAVEETALLHRGVVKYMAGEVVGYVTDIDDTNVGLALHLSDGNRIALNGVAVRSRRLVAAHVESDLIRPMSVVRDGMTYRLQFSNHLGSPLEFYARRVSLQPSLN